MCATFHNVRPEYYQTRCDCVRLNTLLLSQIARQQQQLLQQQHKINLLQQQIQVSARRLLFILVPSRGSVKNCYFVITTVTNQVTTVTNQFNWPMVIRQQLWMRRIIITP